MRLDPHADRHLWADPQRYWSALTEATASLPTPFASLDRQALSVNASDLVRRSAGVPIRVASKSVRVREVLQAVLAESGFRGILAYSLPEAIWLAQWCDDIVVGYPSVDRDAFARLGSDPELAARITVMIDSPEHLDLIDAAVGARHRETIRVCLDLDVSYVLPGLRVGVWRSPVRTPAAARAAAEVIARRPGFRLVGVMAYEAQIAGLGDVASGGPAARARTLAVRGFQRRSIPDVAERRGAAVAAIREICELEFVNGGGTGSLESTAADPAVTEVAAGSGLFAPRLFDGYRAFAPVPAAAFCLSVVRKPAPHTATLLGGGWIASGPPGPDRQPSIVWPQPLRMLPNEMAGEVQTPVRGAAAHDLRVGDRVWLRHAKAGELCEHVQDLVLLDGGQPAGRLATYRGEGKDFL